VGPAIPVAAALSRGGLYTRRAQRAADLIRLANNYAAQGPTSAGENAYFTL